MLEFGKSLKIARDAKGLTVEQLADMTHMPIRVIHELENEDFSGFAAPIYGRGFVKLYCGAVGLEPKPFLDEFMEIYNGNRDLVIREREPEVTQPPPVVTPEPPIAEAPPIVEAPSIVEAPPVVELRSEPEQLDLISETIPAQPSFSQPLFNDEPEPQDTTSRYSSPMYDELPTKRSFSIPPVVWRLTLLAAVVAGILWAAFTGLKALYRSTCGTPPTEAKTATVETKNTAAETKNTASKPASSAPRTPQKIPPLYID